MLNKSKFYGILLSQTTSIPSTSGTSMTGIQLLTSTEPFH
jgi:hypothetical protein